VRPPGDPPRSPQRLRSVDYQRPFAHIKHTGGFGQTHLGHRARRDGFDDVLLCTPDGAICEAAIANVGFLDGDAVVWPDGPALRGITLQVLERRLSQLGVPWRREALRTADAQRFDGAFVTNARGIAAVGAIDDVAFPAVPAALARLHDAYESAEWDAL
jgi:branched-subunit amino acid aminotransferase/4-amino-4-deoxychorismate lyase